MIDYNGLWIVDRNYQDRAEVTCDCGDTIAQLAEIIGLSADKFALWLKPVTGETLLGLTASKPMSSQRTFTVPNKAFIDVSSYSWGLLGWELMAYKSGLEQRWSNEKLSVKYFGKWTTTSQLIFQHLADNDLYKYAYIGHGINGWLTGLSGDVGSISPGKYTIQAINELHLVACYTHTGSKEWKRNVSKAGWLRSVSGKGTAFSVKFIDEHGEN